MRNDHQTVSDIRHAPRLLALVLAVCVCLFPRFPRHGPRRLVRSLSTRAAKTWRKAVAVRADFPGGIPGGNGASLYAAGGHGVPAVARRTITPPPTGCSITACIISTRAITAAHRYPGRYHDRAAEVENLHHRHPCGSKPPTVPCASGTVWRATSVCMRYAGAEPAGLLYRRADGDYGEKTNDAMKQFQRARTV